ncbi:MAG: hypothetical protein JXR39_03785 [Marinilabiliaceae bacterium]|nr:hypothetical protein [Marinilabiliaceae bacterium]
MASGTVPGAVSSAKPTPHHVIKTVSIKELASNNGALPVVEEKMGEAVVDENAGVDPTWSTPVTPDGLKAAWLGYAARIESSNSRLHSILINHIPTIQKENIVYLELIHAMQETEVQREKPALFKHLKISLKNARLALEIAFKKEENVQAKVFTASDKYKVMKEKNPALAELSRLFDLDIE